MFGFGDAERKILSYFKEGTKVVFKEQLMNVVESGKPTCTSGEPKTDIYVLLTDGTYHEEIKISYKKENADFLENKTNSIRAEQLFGYNWREIISSSTKQIRENFEARPRIYKNRFGRVEKGSITLGWKFELLNKPSGDLSGLMELSHNQICDIYAGMNLSLDKRNAYVNGRMIKESGVANYILMTDQINNAQEAIDEMISIDEFSYKHSEIYFACKALNYRTFTSKYDGNRPLAVQVDWFVNSNGKLDSNLVFDCPLEYNGDETADKLLACLNKLYIDTTDDINENNANTHHIYKKMIL